MGLRYLAEVRADHAVTVPDVGSQRHPFHLVAPGLVTMAFWPNDRYDAYVSGELAAPTSSSMTDPDELRRRMRAIRENLHAWTDQELDDGVNGCAVPVLDGEGGLVATISVFGPAYRFSPEAHPDLGDELERIVRSRASALLR